MDEARFQRPPSPYPTEVQIDPDNEKRVIDIQPGSGKEKIRCHVSPQSLTSHPSGDYEALSYVWGDWENHGTISLNGIPDFPVTRNLLRALRRVRTRDRPRRVWIDQISINQQEKAERKRQVKQIGRIFSQASRVIVWLGESDEDIDYASKDGRDFFTALRKACSDGTANPWWSRAWVIEEFVLSKRDPLVMFGPYQREWAGFMEPKEEWNSYGPAAQKRDKDAGMGDPVKEMLIVNLHMLNYNRMRVPKGEHNLHALTAILRQTNTLDPRDKVYCALASLSNTERGLITVDYDKSVSEVFSHATYASIAATGSLGILSLVPRLSSQKIGDMPTWTVDFTFPREKQTIRTIKAEQGPLRLVTQVSELMQPQESYGLFKLFDFASNQQSWTHKNPKTTAEVFFNPYGPRRLVLTGLEFDCVQDIACVDTYIGLSKTTPAETIINYVVPSSTNSLVALFDLKSLNSKEREIHSSIRQRISNISPYYKVIDFSLTYPSTQELGTVRLSRIAALFRAWDKAARPRKARPISEPSLTTMPEIYRGFWSQLTQGEQVGHMRAGLFKFYMLLDTRGVSFFITAAGFVGLGPADLKPDDRIVLCYGSRFPVALRRSSNGNWQFVGFIYVRGIMDHELFDCFPNIMLKETRFILE
ncbi:hypothetical protein N7489_003198 [Penicillium chrysogenum]|uniref:uncharacterized protein n=1 Tax=Penicillium chrysogenum TaxID=5076 RepID=UPI0024DF198F|nr:uncharacterized protein N7489_003198 [Penicillium chrysogenum]KAJ5252788.1 hypothetical protein N7489_003198 [Penicillium chrysogenum]